MIYVTSRLIEIHSQSVKRLDYVRAEKRVKTFDRFLRRIRGLVFAPRGDRKGSSVIPYCSTLQKTSELSESPGQHRRRNRQQHRRNLPQTGMTYALSRESLTLILTSSHERRNSSWDTSLGRIFGFDGSEGEGRGKGTLSEAGRSQRSTGFSVSGLVSSCSNL